MVMTDCLDWATNGPEYKVTAVQIAPSSALSNWQGAYRALSAESRRIETTSAESWRIEAVQAGD